MPENLDLGGQQLTDEVRAQQIASLFELFPILKGRQSQIPETLSGGEQQILAIGRTLEHVRIGDPGRFAAEAGEGYL